MRGLSGGDMPISRGFERSAMKSITQGGEFTLPPTLHVAALRVISNIYIDLIGFYV